MVLRTSNRLTRACAAFAAALVLCVAIAFACGCATEQQSSSSTGPETQSFTDSAGRNVELPATIERVAVSNSSAQEYLLTLAPEKLAGLAEEITETQSKYIGKKAKKLPVYGRLYGNEGVFSQDVLKTANPQVIIDISDNTETVGADMDKLQQQTGIPVVHLENTFDSVTTVYDTLGNLLDVQDRAHEICSFIDSARSTVSSSLQSLRSEDMPRVAYLLGDNASSTMPEKSAQAAALDKIVANVMKLDYVGVDDDGSKVSFEQLSLWNPDVIIFSSQKAFENLPQDESWKNLSAIKYKTYCKVPTTPYNWLSSPVGPNQLLGYVWLAHVCYPSAFDISMQSQVTSYFDIMYGHKLSSAEYKELMADATPVKKISRVLKG